MLGFAAADALRLSHLFLGVDCLADGKAVASFMSQGPAAAIKG